MRKAAVLLLGCMVLAGCERKETTAERKPEPAGKRAAAPQQYRETDARNPNAGDLLLHDGKLYVALERRKGFEATENGLLLVVDTATDKIESTIPLGHKNPQSLAVHGGILYVALSGEVYGEERGALEAVDLASRKVSTVLTSEALGGDPVRLEPKTGTVTYVQVRTGHGRAKVLEVDLAQGKILSTLAGPDDVHTLDYSPAEDRLWIGRRREDQFEGEGEVEVFDGGGRRVAGPFRASLPPFSLLRTEGPGARRTLLVGSDLESGTLAWSGEGEAQPFTPGEIKIHQDSEVRGHGGQIFVLERFGADNILKYDPSRGGEQGIVYRIHLGEHWNPVDLELASERKAYVSLENHPEILIFDPEPGKVVSRIDISGADS
jgi:hypothetical protein